ncbi:MAG TPA: SDR family NAD(P)-dependent oxidoreductase [Polyangiaceae bacterium]|nr:SDR family NAD(P)-dependent oxidoreductase [Polyangiaceae bacterium]
MRTPTSLGPLALAAGLGLLTRHFARRARRLELRGKVVVITGGSRGLGLEVARELGRRGCRLAVCARDGVALERARRELAAAGVEVMAASCDASDEAEVGQFIAAVEARFGGVDALVANAATIQVGPLESMTRRDFADAFEHIFWSAYHPTMAVLPGMRRRRAGRVVHITSIGGKIGVPHLAPYCSAKFALVGFSETLRAELAGTGVRVTTVVPGLMRTGSHVNASFKGQAAKEFAWFSLAATSPLTAVSAPRAARQVVDALEHGDAERVISLPAKLAALAHGLAPGLVSELMGAQKRLLPSADAPGAPSRGADVAREAPASSLIEAFGGGSVARYNQRARG